MSEETKSYHPWQTILAAIIIVALGIAAYAYFGRVPVPYSAKILSVNIYPIHRDLTQKTTTEGIGGGDESWDEILLMVNVRITNRAKIPLYLQDMWSVVTFPNESDRSSAVSESDFQKIFVAYPETKQYEKPPLLRDITLRPGQQVEGMMIFNYQMNQTQWASATSTDINLSFIHQNPLVMHIAAK